MCVKHSLALQRKTAQPKPRGENKRRAARPPRRLAAGAVAVRANCAVGLLPGLGLGAGGAVNRLPQSLDQHVEFVVADDERRRQQYVIAVLAVDGATHRIAR